MPRPSLPGLLRDPDFGRLFAATALGQLGDRITFLALPLVAVTALRADAFQVGLLAATTSVGSLLVGLPAGAWVDRVRKRSVMIAADLLRAAALATVPVLWWADRLTVLGLYAIALIHGVLTVFFDVAYVGFLPHLVGRGRLVEGNAKLSAVRSATSIGGPALAGPLVGLVGAPVTLLASAAGLAVSGLVALSIRTRERKPESGDRPRPGREIAEGLTFTLGHPALRAIALGDALFNLSLALYLSMLPVFLEREVGLRPFGIGLILSGMGGGALVGALLARTLSERVGLGPVIWLASLVTCPSTALMPMARPGWSVYVAALGLAALSLGGVVRFVAQSSVQQAVTPDRLLGRMSATSRFVSWGGIPIGGLLGGASGSVYGPAGALWFGAVGMTLSVLPTFLSPLRALRTPPPWPLPSRADRARTGAADRGQGV
ncbi:MFS transporter [Streptomyces virginiae]|uniref:MFS transporter n=1 Tax=Streptomyces virginiae TaxID=1961 RepID=UPI0035DF96E0